MTFNRFLLTASKAISKGIPTMKSLCSHPRRAVMALLLAMGFCLAPPHAMGQNYIPATNAFNSPACSDSKLSGINTTFGTFPSAARLNPEWKAINIDPNHPLPNNPPTILEGFVLSPPSGEVSKDQAPAEVSEEDTPWTHYTHDYGVHVIPDGPYQNLLSSWMRLSQDITTQFAGDDVTSSLACLLVGGSYIGNNTCLIAKADKPCPDGSTGTTCHYTDMELEWDNASLMDEGEGSQRDWGAVPEFVWPAVGDRVWVEGRWIFDCGHPGVSPDLNNASSLGLLPSGTSLDDWVKFSTEIHPPRALVAFRLNHPALDSFPRSRDSAPNFPAPQSYLPVTGEPVTLAAGVTNSGPTNVPVTEADIFVSGNGGGASDLCSVVPESCDTYLTLYGAQRTPIVPVNDRNYVIDIYPPGTDYGTLDPNGKGTFVVHPPVVDASLQWRMVDHSGELPLHACGTADGSGCVTVTPTICLLDNTTPPPDQTETGCPAAVPAQPTRLRVILPFAGSTANYFAQSILLGWDDVPAAQNNTLAVRTFQVELSQFGVKSDGESVPFASADWRVIVSVGGQYRYISRLFDTNANSNEGIYQFDGGSNLCHGDRLTHTADGDCFYFNNTPWTVSVVDKTPIHVHVGGYQAQSIESSFCRNFPGGCGPNVVLGADLSLLDLIFSHFTRIGTYEFDLMPPDYSPPAPFTTARLDCPAPNIFDCGLQYDVEFGVQEVQAAAPPASSPLVIGTPSYTDPAGALFISSATNLIPQTADDNVEGFQYRFHQQGGPLPTYASALPFPVHWAHADLPTGVHSVSVYLKGANLADGPYDFQYSAETFGDLLEPRHTITVILDNTPPVATIAMPTATQYVHSDMFTISYTVSDGAGSGVKSAIPNIDGLATLQDGTPVALNQTVNLLTALALGTHTFNVVSTDKVNNTRTNMVTFSVIVTAESIKKDVTEFVAAGKITVDTGNSLLGILDAAANARAAGKCATANQLYQAFITQVQALSGKKIDPTAAQIMIGDAQYLIAHCP